MSGRTLAIAHYNSHSHTHAHTHPHTIILIHSHPPHPIILIHSLSYTPTSIHKLPFTHFHMHTLIQAPSYTHSHSHALIHTLPYTHSHSHTLIDTVSLSYFTHSIGLAWAEEYTLFSLTQYFFVFRWCSERERVCVGGCVRDSRTIIDLQTNEHKYQLLLRDCFHVSAKDFFCGCHENAIQWKKWWDDWQKQ